MKFPPAEVMHLLDALTLGVELVADPDTGVLALVMPDGVACEIDGDDFDALLARQWIAVDLTELRLTEQGRYALRRWARLQDRRSPATAAG